MAELTQLTLWEKQTPRTGQVEIDRILANPDALSLQQRVQNSEETINDYRTAILEGEILPPITLFETDGQLWVADGIHRLLATKQTGRTTIDAIIYTGTKRDALLYAVGANGTHGLRRSREDKRKAVQTLLSDPEWSRLSDREIARLTHTSHPFVAELRRQQQRAAPKTLSQTRPAPATTQTAPATPPPAQSQDETQEQTTPAEPAGNVTTPQPSEPPQEIDYRSAILDALSKGRGMTFAELFYHITGKDDRDPAHYHEWNTISLTAQKLVDDKLVVRLAGVYYARPQPANDNTNYDYHNQNAANINVELDNLIEQLQHAYIAIFGYTMIWLLSLNTPPKQPIPRLNMQKAIKAARMLRDIKDMLENLIVKYQKREDAGNNIPATPEKPGYCPECSKEGMFIGTLFLDNRAEDVFNCPGCGRSFTVTRQQGA